MEESHEAQGQTKMKITTSNRNTDRKTDSSKRKKNLEQQQADGDQLTKRKPGPLK